MRVHRRLPAAPAVLYVLALVLAGSAALLGGGELRRPATAAEGDGSFVLCKQYWATGPSIDVDRVRFDFLVEFEVPGDDAEPFGVSLDPIESGEECSDPIVVPAGAAVTVTETLPEGWVNVPTYPRSLLEIDGVEGPLTTNSTVARFSGNRCVDEDCVLIFKNKRDETGDAAVPPLTDPFRGSLSVCKAFVDNGDEVEIGPTAFTFHWSDKFRSFDFPIGPFIPEGITGCTNFSVIDVYPGDTVTVSEFSTDAFNDAPGFPKIEVEGPNGFAAKPGNTVTIELTTCSGEGGQGPTVSLIDGEPTFDCRVTFSNRAVGVGERGSIRVQKVTREIVEGSPIETADHAGWAFTLRSNDCETIETGVTDDNGFVQWDGLGLCPDYTVTEDTENAPFAGYQPVNGGIVAGIQPGLESVTEVVMVNERVVVSEPCEACTQPEPDPVVDEPTPVVVEPEPTEAPVVVIPEPTETPVVVTPEPTTPAPPAQETTTPTPDSPAEPTVAVPTPEETVAGEVTPGPQPTPLAPDTGSGVVASDGGKLGISLGLAVLSLACFLGGLVVSRRE